MKFVAFFLILVVCLFLDQARAQCSNAPRRTNCASPIVKGRSGKDCKPVVRWGLDPKTKRCKRYQYLGCGGNSNRFCNLAACKKQCERSS